jgi:hypothetical protein
MKKIKKIKITERQLNLLKENLESKLKIGLPKEFIQAIEMNKTSLGDHPAFPPDDETSFVYKLFMDRFQTVLSDFNTTFSNVDSTDTDVLKTLLSELLKQCSTIEKSLKNQLEHIVIDIIKKIFGVNKDDVALSVEMVDVINKSDIKIPLKPESTSDDEVEFEGIEDIHGLNDDVYKRRMVNCLMQGIANRFIHLHEFYTQEIHELSPDLLPLYAKIICLNDLILFYEDANIIQEDRITYGSTSEVIVKSYDKSVVRVRGINFISCLHEAIKATLDLISFNGLPKDRNKLKYVLKKADFRLAGEWDERFGIPLWLNIESKIGENFQSNLIPGIFYTIVSLDTTHFNLLLQNIFAGTIMGKKWLKKIINNVEHQQENDLFYDELNNKRTLIADDGFFKTEEI